MRVSKLEKVISVLLFILTWVVLAMQGGHPIFSDELLYIDAGLNNTQVPSYGNRYFHVYLQKLFMALAPTPVNGIGIYWGFLIALTALLVYWNARLFFKHSSPLHGIIALAIFFSYRFIAQYCGVTSVDITAMVMVLVLLTIYLVFIRSGRKLIWAPFVLGAVAFLCFKTKETTLFSFVILLGLFFDDQGKFSLNNLIPILKPLAIGFALAVGLFILLDTIFLHNPFFAISPATLSEVFKNYAYTGSFRREPSSYYNYLLVTLMLPFLLYLASGIKRYDSEISPTLKIVWLFPLVLAFFMTLNMLKIPWGFIERFYFPALPVIALLAPQFIDFKWPKTIPEKIRYFGLLLLGVGLVFILRRTFMGWTSEIQWDYGRFLDTIYYPLLISILLAFILLIRRFTWMSSIIPLICIFALLLAPLAHTYKYIFRVPNTTASFNLLYYPFIAFEEKIHYSPEMSFYLSPNIENELHMLSLNRDELVAMFNVFFDGRARQSNFTIGWEPEKILEDITRQTYDYVLLTGVDWNNISANLIDKNSLEEIYTHWVDSGKQIVLLSAR